MKPFFDWQFQEKKFDFALIAPSRKKLLSIIFKEKPSFEHFDILLTQEEALRNKTELEKSALHGYELLFATKSNNKELEGFFKKYGYISTGSAHLGDHSKHDLLTASWNSKRLLHGLKLAHRMQAYTLCCFAHDADPVYILSQS